MVGRLIAVVGVDGVGKSTLVDRLALAAALPDAVFLRRPKGPATHGERVRRHVSARHGDARDWLAGDFAQWMSVALAADFLHHYVDTILPALEQHAWVVCDRYADCYLAQGRVAGCEAVVGRLLMRVMTPDLTLRITASPEVLALRRSRRGPADDESPELARRTELAYDALLARGTRLVRTVRNDHGPDDALEVIGRHLRELTTAA